MARRGGRQGAQEGEDYDSVQVDGWEILVGRGARQNDRLTFQEAAPRDFWLHVAHLPGSHVVIRNPDHLPEAPKAVVQEAAQLAVRHSKARRAGGKVPVHLCRVADVSKRRGAPAGQVRLARFEEVKVYPKE